MNNRLLFASLVAACFSLTALAKLPPPPPAPPPDPIAAAAKAEKDKAVAEKAKAVQVAAEERTVKNFQANMKKAGKPIPKPTPIIVATAPPVPAALVKPGAVPVTATPAAKSPEAPTKK